MRPSWGADHAALVCQLSSNAFLSTSIALAATVALTFGVTAAACYSAEHMQQQPPHGAAGSAPAANEDLRSPCGMPAGHDSAAASDTAPLPHPLQPSASPLPPAAASARGESPAAADTSAVQLPESQQQQQEQQSVQELQAQQQLLLASLSLGFTADAATAAYAAAANLQPQLCLPRGMSLTGSSPQGPAGQALPAATATAAAQGSPVTATTLGQLSSAVSVLAGASRAQLLPCPGAPAAAAASAAILSPSSSSSSAAMGVAVAGSSSTGEGPTPLGILDELGVSLESLQRLLTADYTDAFEQPVWMVVNLQGKIKGSYTPDKMLEFCRRGTLSSTQLLLGIDQNLPYLARQDLSYYRTVEVLLKAVHAGGRYTPLSEQIVTSLKQQGIPGSQWEPLAPQDQPRNQALNPGTSLQQGSASGSGVLAASEGGSVGSGSRPSTPAAAAAAQHLRMALEMLCGCSVTEAMLSDPITAQSAAAQVAAAEAAAAAASSSTAAAAAGSDGSSSSQDTAVAAAAAAAASAAAAVAPVSAQSSSSPGAAATAAAGGAAAAATAGTAGSSSPVAAKLGGQEAMWLYINHLGWCRGPFPGARVVQAHMCGRLPRDTLIAAHQPDIPSAVISSDIAYFFRPLGVLLDNVAQGWTYSIITWNDVAGKGAGGSTSMPLSPAAVWQPLKWQGLGPPPPLLNPEQLQPPTNIPTGPHPLQTGAQPGRGRGARPPQGASSASATAGGRYAARLAKRAQAILPIDWSPPQLLPQPQQHAPAASAPEQQQRQQQQQQPPQAQQQQVPVFGPGSYLLPPEGSMAASMGPSSGGSSSSITVGAFSPLLPPVPPSPPTGQQQQQQQMATAQHAGGILVGHVQAQGNQPPLPVYAPRQMLLSSSGGPQTQMVLRSLQQQQQQQTVQIIAQAPAPPQQQQQQTVHIIAQQPPQLQQLQQQLQQLQQQQQQQQQTVQIIAQQQQPQLQLVQPSLAVLPSGQAGPAALTSTGVVLGHHGRPLFARVTPHVMQQGTFVHQDNPVLLLLLQQQQQQLAAPMGQVIQTMLQPVQQQAQQQHAPVLQLQPLGPYLQAQEQQQLSLQSLDQVLQQQLQLDVLPAQQDMQQQQSLLQPGQLYQQPQMEQQIFPVQEQQYVVLQDPQQQIFTQQNDPLQQQQQQQLLLLPESQQPPQQQQQQSGQVLPFWQPPF